MLYQIISLLLEVVAGIVGGACLLRLYMQHLRIPMSVRSGNPLGRFVFALTDWLVLPLRRVLPAVGALGHGQPGGGLFVATGKVSWRCGCSPERAVGSLSFRCLALLVCWAWPSPA